MDELRQWLEANPPSAGEKNFQWVDIPPHLAPLLERVIGEHREEHPNNAEVLQLIQKWAAGNRA
ncbi:hypothetical protein GCM10028773_33860 [Spirosoma koreense]